MPNKQVIELTFTDDHDQEVKTEFSVHDAYSVYELWVALPGNAGKSRADYVESLRGTQGKSLAGVETVITELDPPKPEWVWLPAPDPVEDIKIGEVAKFTMTLTDANETVDPYPKATWVAKDKDDKLIDEGEVMPDSNGQYTVGLLHNGECEGKISVTFTVEGNASGSCYFIFGNEKVVRNYQWSELSGRPDPVPYGETVKFTGKLADLNNVPLPLPKVKFELINVMTMETVHTAEVPANAEFPGLYEIDILNDLEKPDNHVGIFTAVDPNGETLKRADDIAVEFLSEQRALEWGEVETSPLDKPLLFGSWFNYRVELLGDDPRLAKVELHTGKSVDNIIRRVDCVRVDGTENWWLGSLINNEDLEAHGQDREVIVAAIAYDASGNELTGYSPVVTVKLGNRPSWLIVDGDSTNPIELENGESAVVDKFLIDDGRSGLPYPKVIKVIDGNDSGEVTPDAEGRITHTVTNNNTTSEMVEVSVEFRAELTPKLWSNKTRVQLLPAPDVLVWGDIECDHEEGAKVMYGTRVTYKAQMLSTPSKLRSVELRLMKPNGTIAGKTTAYASKDRPGWFEGDFFWQYNSGPFFGRDPTGAGYLTMVVYHGTNEKDIYDEQSEHRNVVFGNRPIWKWRDGKSPNAATLHNGETLLIDKQVYDSNNSGLPIPNVIADVGNTIKRDVVNKPDGYCEYTVQHENDEGDNIVTNVTLLAEFENGFISSPVTKVTMVTRIPEWEFYDGVATPNPVPFGEVTAFSIKIRDLNKTGSTELPMATFSFPNVGERDVFPEDGGYTWNVQNPNYGGMPADIAGQYRYWDEFRMRDVYSKEIVATFRPDETGPVDPGGGGGILDPF